jgi:hypothetical protein
MALKVIGAGLGRTGTMSLKLALEQLGFAPCYHMIEVIQNPERLALWNRVVESAKPDWDEVFDGYEATVDWPACNYYRDLMALYPDAKVILSVRSPESWYASTQATIFAAMDQVRGPGGMSFARKLVTDVVGPDLRDRDALIAAFERWNEEVKAAVPKDNLLVFEAAHGWAPLCDFLGIPAPDAPYPETNTTEEFRARFAGRALP